MSKQNETLYIVHYVYGGEHTFEGITNNFDAWLKEHNSCREEGTEEDADDFDVEEVEISYFEGGK